MRNLKRTLSLVLAAAMLIGMMVVSASAASSDFTDASEITREEAVGVMTALNVFEGTDSGAFNPTGTLTREQAAAIVARMLLGDDADDLSTNSAVFSDVAANRWSAGYIGYCAQQGILAGTGDGTFDPEGELTGLAFAKMLLVALGYKADSEGYVGNDWAVNVAADAVNAGISPSGIVLANAINREDAAQMAFQTLEADMVTYSGSSSTTVTGSDGTTIIISGSAEEVTNSESDDYRDDPDERDEIQQFCEYYFEDLEKEEGYPDDFGRPSVRWRNGTSEIGTYSETPEATFTAGTDKGDLYDVIGRDIYNELTDEDSGVYLYVYINGEEQDEGSDYELSDYFVRNETDDASNTGRGILTEVFVDEDSDDVTITHIWTYVAQVDGDYNADDGELDLDVVEGTALEDVSVDDYTLYDEDFSSLSSYADGDYVLVTVADREIQSIQPADVITGSVTSYTQKSNVSLDGTRYYYNKSFTDAVSSSKNYNLNDEYMLVMDTYGYIVYSDGTDGTESYVFISRVAATNGVSDEVEARAYFQNGTTTTIVVDEDSSATVPTSVESGYDGYVGDELKDLTTRVDVYTWYEYDEQSNGDYELNDIDGQDMEVGTAYPEADSDETFDIALSGSAYVYYNPANSSDRIRADNSTVFIINDDDDISIYTGVRNLPDVSISNGMDAVVSWVVEDNYAVSVYIEADNLSVSGGSSDRVYILNNAPDESVDSDGNDYYEYDAIVNGEITTVSASNDVFDEIGLYNDISYDSNDYVNDADLVTGTSDDDFKAHTGLEYATISYSGGVLSFDDVDLVLADDYTIFFNDDGDGETMTASSLSRDFDEDNFTGDIYVYENDDDEALEVYVYATDTTPSEEPDSYSVTLEKASGMDSSNKVTIGDTSLTMAEGDEVTVTLTNEADWSSDSYTVTAEGSNGEYSCTDVEVSGTEMTFTLTATSISGDDTVSISWEGND